VENTTENGNLTVFNLDVVQDFLYCGTG